MKKFLSRRGQAVVEMAVFGSLVLLLFGTLLSYMQRMNDQQYVKMEAFRQALKKACTEQGNVTEGAGSSVQYTMMQNRRHVDVSSGFHKGSSSSASGSADVYWAVPKVGEDSKTYMVFKINDDEYMFDYDDRSFVPESNNSSNANINYSVRIEDTYADYNTSFNETINKQETAEGIINRRASNLTDKVNTRITYTIRQDDTDDDADNDVIYQNESDLINVDQWVYRDADGQYRYNKNATGNTVYREKEWDTQYD